MEDLVLVMNDRAICTSLQVAEKFEKRHDNVIQSVRGLLKNKDTQPMFELSYYVNKQNNQKYPMYLMNRDGFSLLVMGFNGKSALDWKIKYISAFNKMEEMLNQRNTQLWIEQRKQGKLVRNAETEVIQSLVSYAKEQGSTHADMLYMTYSRLANRMTGISDRNLATLQQLNELSFVENIILNKIRLGMRQGKHYKEIYKDCKTQIELFRSIAYLE